MVFHKPRTNIRAFFLVTFLKLEERLGIMKQFDIQKKECSCGDKISIQHWLVVSNIFYFHPHLTHSANGPALNFYVMVPNG